MQGLAEVDGNAIHVRQAQQLLERDIGPLAKEVKRALDGMGRDELFSSSYRAPPDIEYGGGGLSDGLMMDSLIQSSDALLRESQSILAETEQIGTTTLFQMGRQREQLQNTNRHLNSVQEIAVQAKNILTAMSRRACRSRLALYCMIGTLIFANFYVIYRIYKKHHRH
jgi:vesicle transport through interaction with t-SNAREs 1